MSEIIQWYTPTQLLGVVGIPEFRGMRPSEAGNHGHRFDAYSTAQIQTGVDEANQPVYRAANITTYAIDGHNVPESVGIPGIIPQLGVLSTIDVPGTYTFVISATDELGNTGHKSFSIKMNPPLAIDDDIIEVTGNESFTHLMTASGGFQSEADGVMFSLLSGGQPINADMDRTLGTASWRFFHVLAGYPWLVGGDYPLSFQVRDSSFVTPITFKTVIVRVLPPAPHENIYLEWLEHNDTTPPQYDANAPVGRKVIISLIQLGPNVQQTVEFYLNDPAYNGWVVPNGWTLVNWSLVQESMQPDAAGPQHIYIPPGWPLTDPVHLLEPVPGVPELNPQELKQAIELYRQVLTELNAAVEGPIQAELVVQTIQAGPVSSQAILDGGRTVYDVQAVRLSGVQALLRPLRETIEDLKSRFLLFNVEHNALVKFFYAGAPIPPAAQNDDELKAELEEAKILYDIVEKYIDSRKKYFDSIDVFITNGLKVLENCDKILKTIEGTLGGALALLPFIDQKSIEAKLAIDTGDIQILIPLLQWAGDTYTLINAWISDIRGLPGAVAASAATQIQFQVLQYFVLKIFEEIEFIW